MPPSAPSRQPGCRSTGQVRAGPCDRAIDMRLQRIRFRHLHTWRAPGHADYTIRLTQRDVEVALFHQDPRHRGARRRGVRHGDGAPIHCRWRYRRLAHLRAHHRRAVHRLAPPRPGHPDCSGHVLSVHAREEQHASRGRSHDPRVAWPTARCTELGQDALNNASVVAKLFVQRPEEGCAPQNSLSRANWLVPLLGPAAMSRRRAMLRSCWLNLSQSNSV